MSICKIPLQVVYIVLFILSSSDGICSEVSIAIVGDMMFGSEVAQIMDREGSLAPFAGTAQVLSSADITFGVLEGGISTRGEPARDKERVFKSKPSAARGLSNAGFDLVSLATPHIMDYGTEAFLDTMEYLSWYGVKYVGAGLDLEEARKPIVVTAGDIKVAFLAYYRGSQFDQSTFARAGKPGLAFPALGELDQDIARVKAQSDVVIVSMYWGIRGEDGGSEISDRQKLYARKIIDSGADLVVGQLLHSLQGIEVYKGKPVFYSLGDFIYGTYDRKVSTGFIVKLILSRDSSDPANQIHSRMESFNIRYQNGFAFSHNIEKPDGE